VGSGNHPYVLLHPNRSSAPIYKNAKKPLPKPIKVIVTPPIRTLDQENDSGPEPAALFFAEVDVAVVVTVAVATNPLAALKPVAVTPYVGTAVISTALVVPAFGMPVAVCVTAASFGADVALGIAAPALAKETIFEVVELKSVCASAILLFSRS
jgi:hypothetical protein